jgi:hypothetical protein
MKSNFQIWCLFAFAIITGCSPHTAKLSNQGLQGSWKLTATLADVGNGKASWQKAEANSTTYVKFNPTGTVEGKALSDATHYKIIDSTHLALTIKHNFEPITYRYQLQANILTLQPPCREACGLRFVRMK